MAKQRLSRKKRHTPGFANSNKSSAPEQEPRKQRDFIIGQPVDFGPKSGSGQLEKFLEDYHRRNRAFGAVVAREQMTVEFVPEETMAELLRGKYPFIEDLSPKKRRAFIRRQQKSINQSVRQAQRRMQDAEYERISAPGLLGNSDGSGLVRIGDEMTMTPTIARVEGVDEHELLDKLDDFEYGERHLALSGLKRSAGGNYDLVVEKDAATLLTYTAITGLLDDHGYNTRILPSHDDLELQIPLYSLYSTDGNYEPEHGAGFDIKTMPLPVTCVRAFQPIDQTTL